VFRLWDCKGCWIEGAYVAVIPNRLVAFSWGGIEGLRIGQSIVTFTLEFDGHATVVGLRHSHLPDSAVNMHRLGWTRFGLPRPGARPCPGGDCPRVLFCASHFNIPRTHPILITIRFPRVRLPFLRRLKPALVPAIAHQISELSTDTQSSSVLEGDPSVGGAVG